MTDVPYGNGIGARVSGLERRVDRIEDLEPAVIKERVGNVEREMGTLGDEFRALRRALYAFAISISLGAIGFAFTVFSLLGGH